MTRLLDLPDEVLVLISHEVLPADFQQFVLVCQRLHAVSDDALQHHRSVKKAYEGSDDTPNERMNQPDFLKQILLNPHLAFYVRTLNLTKPDPWPNCRHSAKGFVPKDAWIALLAGSAKGIRLSEFSERSDEQEVGWWYFMLSNGHMCVYAGLMLSRLTHLSTLELSDTSRQWSPHDMLRMLETMLTHSNCRPLARLKTVRLTRRSSNPSFFQLLTLFMSLPTMKAIVAIQPPNLLWEPAYGPPSPARSSTVTSLALEGGTHLAATFLHQILAQPRVLESFSYRNIGREMLPAERIQESLKASCRESLRSLELSTDSYRWSLPDFSQFSNLTRMSIDDYALFPCYFMFDKSFPWYFMFKESGKKILAQQQPAIAAARKILPPSLRYLRIVSDFCSSSLQVVYTLRSMAEDKGRTFSKLTELSLLQKKSQADIYPGGLPLALENLKLSCVMNGIEFSVVHKNLSVGDGIPVYG